MPKQTTQQSWLINMFPSINSVRIKLNKNDIYIATRGTLVNT